MEIYFKILQRLKTRNFNQKKHILKKSICLLIFSLISVYSFAQQATEIDPKFVKLPRYSDLTAINAIPSPQQGMIVYNVGTGSNWVYNGTAWGNTSRGVLAPLSLTWPSVTPFEATIGSVASGTTGHAGSFINSNLANTQSALIVSTSGSGYGLFATTEGSGTAIRAASNTRKAGIFEISSPSNLNDVLTLYNSGSGVALNSINLGLGPSGAFQINNGASLGTALTATTTGLGKSGDFRVNNPANFNNALQSLTNGTGNALVGNTTGTGKAGDFEISNSFNTNFAVSALTNGLGSAGKFSISNPSNSSSAIEVKTLGSGFAGTFSGTNAIQADGLIKNKGFTQLGELSPVIKTVAFGQYIGAGSVQTIAHGLSAKSILSINVFALVETGLPPELRIPPSFKSLLNEYYYEYYFDDDKIYFIIPSTSTKVKNFFARVLITYTE